MNQSSAVRKLSILFGRCCERAPVLTPEAFVGRRKSERLELSEQTDARRGGILTLRSRLMTRMMMENRRVFLAGRAEISEQPPRGCGCGMREGLAAAAAAAARYLLDFV